MIPPMEVPAKISATAQAQYLKRHRDSLAVDSNGASTRGRRLAESQVCGVSLASYSYSRGIAPRERLRTFCQLRRRRCGSRPTAHLFGKFANSFANESLSHARLTRSCWSQRQDAAAFKMERAQHPGKRSRCCR